MDIIGIHTRLLRTEAALDDRSHEFRISDSSVDSYGTVFLPSSWDLSWRDSGKRQVTYGHPDFNNPDPDVVIGLGQERTEDDGLYSILTLEPEGSNPLADKVHHKLQFGTLTDASIVAEVLDGRPGIQERGEDPSIFYFTRARLINWGVVMVGSNSNAVKTRSQLADFIASKTNTLQEEVDKQSNEAQQLLEQIERNRQFIKALRIKHYLIS